MAKAIGGLRQGAMELSPTHEAVLDLAVEQALAPALKRVSESFVQVMLEQGVPIEAIVTELVLSGEVERTYRLVRSGRRRRPDALPLTDQSVRADCPAPTATSTWIWLRPCGIWWTTSRRGGSPTNGNASATPATRASRSCRSAAMAPEIMAFEADLRSKLGEGATPR